MNKKEKRFIERINVNITKEQKEFLDSEAEAKQTTMQAIIRQAIQNEIDKKEKVATI